MAGTTGTSHAARAVNLSSVAAGDGGFVIKGESDLDFSGSRVSGAGDVNGDGIADLIVGAYAADPNEEYAGRAYVVFGKSDTRAVNLSDVAAGIGGFVINGVRLYDEAGYSVSMIGDVNGDGLADLVVGAPSRVFAEGFVGRAYVIFGKTTTEPVNLSNIELGVGGFVIMGGPNHDDGVGYAVSGAGDVNGDGFDDLIIGAGFGEGQCYVVFGKRDTRPVNVSEIESGNGGFLISRDLSGFSVSAAGDVNGDGLDDIIVGSPYAAPNGGYSVGQAYVVFGKTGTSPVELSAIVAGIGGLLIDSDVSGRAYGWNVAGAGDVNGDGLADVILMGGSYSSPGCVVFGKMDTKPVEISAIIAGTGGFLIAGQPAYDQGSYGYSVISVAGAGDVNGDGFADLIVGTKIPYADVAYSTRSFVIFGKPGTKQVNITDVIGGRGGFAVNEVNLGDSSGSSVAAAGDINGDGLADVIIGAPRSYYDGPPFSGRSYVVFSPLKPPAYPRYRAHTRPGDGPGHGIIPETKFPDGRAKIKFSDDDRGNNGAGGASLESVKLVRTRTGIVGLKPLSNVANVRWKIATNRVGLTSADVTLKFTDAEIAGIDKRSLRVYTAASALGPWKELDTRLDLARNEAKVTVKHFGVFALVGTTAGPNSIPQVLWRSFE